MVWRARLVSLVLVALIAGCTAEAPASDSQTPGALFDSANPAAPSAQPAGTGGIVGAVVDEAIRPIQNATVLLPGPDLTRSTAEDGSFSFLGLEPGAYRIVVSGPDHQPQETAATVLAGELAQVRVVLTLDPARLPYNVTMKFTGFAEVAQPQYVAPFFTLVRIFVDANPCERCRFIVDATEGLQGLVVEATMADNGQPAGESTYAYSVYRDDDEMAWSFNEPNPLYAAFPSLGGSATHLEFNIYPESYPLPELNKQFEVFVTLFYNDEIPEGFSFIRQG